MSATATDLARELHRNVGHAAMLAQRIALMQEDVPTWTYFGKAKERTGSKTREELAREARDRREAMEAEWEATIQEISDSFFAHLDLDQVIRWAQTSWTEEPVPAVKRAWRILKADDKKKKADEPPAYLPPTHEEAAAQVMASLNSPPGLLAQQAVQMYLGQASATGVHAGQTALDHMGLNKTFAWAHPRAMARDMYAVRGSKVVTQLYDDHISKLAQIITRATNPRHPLTIDQVKKLIAQEWPKIQARDVARIARTETAALWTATSMNTYAANGITQFGSLLAEGPSIGIDSEDPCDECIDMAAAVHDIEDDPPPWHPNCRCEAIPILQDDNGEPWLPPDEPWAGEDIPMCEEPEAIELRRRADIQKGLALRIGARLKKTAGVDAACLIPAPEPGQSFGGETFQTSAPLTDAQLQLLLKEVSDWADFSGDSPQYAVKVLAKEVLRSSRRKKLAFNAQTKRLTGVADFDDGLMFPGKPQTIYVRRIASAGGGARKVLSAIARDAYTAKKALAVDATGVSKQMVSNLEKYGFTKVEDTDAWYMERDKLKDTFHIEEHEIPVEPPLPAHTPVAPTPTDDLATLTAKKKSAQNRLAGHRKKLKVLREQPLKNAEKIAEFEAKEAAEVQEIADLNEKLAAHAVPEHAPIPEEVGHKPVEMPEPAPVLPEIPAAPEMKAAAYDGEIIKTPEGEMPVDESFEALRDESKGWLNAAYPKAGDYPDLILTDIEEAAAEEGLPSGLLALRDGDGNLKALVRYTEREKPFLSYEVDDIALANEEDAEGALRAITQMSKLARDRGVDELRIEPSVPLPKDVADVLTDRGFTPTGSDAWAISGDELKTSGWLDAEPKPLLPEAEQIEDTISVGAGAPITQDELASIFSLGLDGVPEKGYGAIQALKGADSTKQLFYDYKTETWAQDRIEQEWNKIEGAFFKGKTAETGPELFSVHYKNFQTGAPVETIGMNLEDARAFAAQVGGKGVPADVVQVSGWKKTAYFTSGGGGAGKSGSKFLYRGEEMTLAELREQADVIYVNPDDIREMLPEYRIMLDLKDTYAAAGTHAEASAIAKVIQKRAIDAGYSVLVDGTGAGERFLGKLASAKEKGYDVQVTMTSIDTNAAISRSLVRGEETGRYVPIETLKDAHAGASRMMDKWMADKTVSEWRIYDNSGSEPTLVAKGSAGETKEVVDDKLLKRIKDKRYEQKGYRAPQAGAPAPAIPESGMSSVPMVQVEATPETLKVQLYGAQNRVFGHKKKLKSLDAKFKAATTDAEKTEISGQFQVFTEKLAQDEQLKVDIKAKLVQMGHKPVAMKPGEVAKPTETTPAAKPKPTPKPTPKPAPTKGPQAEQKTLVTYEVRYTDAVTGKPVVQSFATEAEAKDAAVEIPASVSAKKPEIVRVEEAIKEPKPKPEQAPAPEVQTEVTHLQPGQHLADEKRVVPGGITKEKGTTILNKKMTDDQKSQSQGGLGDAGMKRRIVQDITAIIKDDPEWDSQTVIDAYGYGVGHYSHEGDEAIISQLIQNWAHSSSDADPRAVAIQIAVKEEFGLDVDVFAAEYWNDKVRSDEVVRKAYKILDGSAWYESNVYYEAGSKWTVYWKPQIGGYRELSQTFDTEAEARAYEEKLNLQAKGEADYLHTPGGRPMHGTARTEFTDKGAPRKPPREALKRFARRQWENTQRVLTELGIDEVTLYRGYRISQDVLGVGEGKIGWNPGLSTVNVKDNPIASWSTRHAIAKRLFSHGTIMRASAPKEMIFGTCLSGFGCASEWEALVMNFGDNAAWVAQNGKIELTSEMKGKLNSQISALRETIAMHDRELTRVAPDGVAPAYGTPERQTYYNASTAKRQAQYEMHALENTLNSGSQRWDAADKEADIKNYIHEAVLENPSLAGKEIKLPKKAAPLSAEEQVLRPYKSEVTGIKRKITNRQKKVAAYKATWSALVQRLAEANPAMVPNISFEQAMKLQYYELSEQGVADYGMRRAALDAGRYQSTIDRLTGDLSVAESNLAAKKKELGYTKAMRKLRRRAGLWP